MQVSHGPCCVSATGPKRVRLQPELNSSSLSGHHHYYHDLPAVTNDLNMICAANISPSVRLCEQRSGPDQSIIHSQLFRLFFPREIPRSLHSWYSQTFQAIVSKHCTARIRMITSKRWMLIRTYNVTLSSCTSSEPPSDSG